MRREAAREWFPASTAYPLRPRRFINRTESRFLLPSARGWAKMRGMRAARGRLMNGWWGTVARTLGAAALAAAVSMGAAAAAEPRVALVIGNGEYASLPLSNPVNDARLMANTLRELGFQVIEHQNLSQKAMKRAIRTFGDRLEKAGAESVGLFYYAGHGVQVDGHNYLIPIGADIDRESDVDIEAVSANVVLKTMARAFTRLNFVILDACRDNPYKRSFRSSVRGLARMDAPRGTLVAYATSPGDVAADGTAANSPYTEVLSRVMRQPGLSAEIVFRRTRTEVMEVTGDRQVPWEESSLTGDFFFGGEAPPPQAPADRETVFWESIRDSDDPADFQAYLDRYPDGEFASLARNRLAALTPPPVAAVMPAPPPPAPTPAPAPEPPSTLKHPAGGMLPRPPEPGTGFQDCPECPPMVVVPAGSFFMGTDSGDPAEGPLHKVVIAEPFAIARHEVTFDQWAACVADGACRRRNSDRGWGRGDRPVLFVSWNNAQSYVDWLRRKTGKPYRLPSEAEWEYAARAGTASRFWWGDEVDEAYANCRGCGSLWDGAGTGPVESFPANAFGLHEMLGNVAEWVADCWHGSYDGAPGDGRPWVRGGDCDRRVVRGGSWFVAPDQASAASRTAFDPRDREDYIGFRVVRSLGR